jgi:hypothetical protein
VTSAVLPARRVMLEDGRCRTVAAVCVESTQGSRRYRNRERCS